MKVEVEILSKHTMIKPSAATPAHLRHYTLSFIDQIIPPIFTPFVLFYPRDANLSNEERVDQIKKSLSEALTHFYPLAGRVKDNSHVDCDDEGAHFVEAKATCTLTEFLEDPNPAEINKFLPFELDEVNEIPFAVQVTAFACGGIVVGLTFAHKVSDASSLFFFLNSWAAIGRGSSDIATPRFDTATIFPPVTLPSYTLPRGTDKDKIVIKRFVFDSAAIATLRAKYSTEDPNIQNPRSSRVEALSAFIWSRFLAATELDSNMPYSLCHVGNLRKRLDPPLSDNYFGNMSLPSGYATSRETEDGFHGIIIPMRDAINKLDGNYVKEFPKDTLGGSNLPSETRKLQKRDFRGGFDRASTSVVPGFPLYDIDSAWGQSLYGVAG
ncbi:Vinorine synthase [Morella rubra]|uniref:Vinorine synthase n=1 Tax=Morella rubra TaxID=262757 RepID=A0A6A1ULW3_9ROSI|nr:Vinorine synthase [Morella rubra]